MTKAKAKRFDCVEVKRQAQRGLTQALAGHSPAEQVEILRQLAEKSPFWRRLCDARRTPAPRSAKSPAKPKKTA